jgi:hypothetical protein
MQHCQCLRTRCRGEYLNLRESYEATRQEAGDNVIIALYLVLLTKQLVYPGVRIRNEIGGACSTMEGRIKTLKPIFGKTEVMRLFTHGN